MRSATQNDDGRGAAASPRSRHRSDTLPKTGPDSRDALAAARIGEGDLAMAKRKAQVALAEYGHALSLAEEADPTLRAQIYTRLGHANRMLATGSAGDCYRQALALDRRQVTALRCLVDEAAQDEDWAEMAELEERLFASIDDPKHRCLELIASGDRWLAAADAPLHARIRYRRALEANPANRTARDRLKALRPSYR